MRKADPNLAATDYYLGPRAWQNRSAEAAPLFRQAPRAKDADTRKDWEAEILKALSESDQPALAYDVLPDRPAVFGVLATTLKDLYRTNDLKLLVAAHEKHHPGERVCLLPRRGAGPRGAVRRCREGVRRGAGEVAGGDEAARFREGGLARSARPGRWRRTARWPADETFRQVAELLLTERRHAATCRP